jgi:hypothetical protein
MFLYIYKFFLVLFANISNGQYLSVYLTIFLINLAWSGCGYVGRVRVGVGRWM